MIRTVVSWKWFHPVIDLQSKMGDSVNANDNGKEKNKHQTFFNRETLKSRNV
jgi:hypothetical protein